MHACSYPDVEAHIRIHKTLRAQVQDIRDRYRRNPESMHSREVLAFLKNWLTAHIVGRDKLYTPFLQNAGQKLHEAETAFDASSGSLVPIAVGH